MIPFCKLDLTFDAARLQEDLAQVAPGEWITHYNRGDFDGQWSGIALKSVAGSASPLYADPSRDATFADTEMMGRLPYARDVVASFQCPVRSVRLLRLGPGSRIREHRDTGLGIEDGEARLHIPVLTNPHVEFVLNNQPVVMSEGETWYLNLSLPHRIKNLGETDRVHLVIDCLSNDWLRSLLPSGDLIEPARSEQQSPATHGGFEAFRDLVLRDKGLQERLSEALDPESFVGLLTLLGRERGYQFALEEVQDALKAGRHAWLERHVR
ncbi:MAG TPA: aspartyl/asparaginyl beta-hydroxylase domain-containing protein [Isosphaeraceae bacterium]|jgi:hypothetical protein|nr:aspartyl/asparaginyl beta-hydroxylase domain-containing protein [Isosphaeraceae bacterium]